jgi:hypothetical protein
MSEIRPDELDARLARLDRDVQPARDLWPEIAAVIAEQPPTARGAGGASELSGWRVGRTWAIAASVLLMVTSSVLTYVLMQRSMQAEANRVQQAAMQQLQPVLATMPASFGGQMALGAEYSQVRAELDARFAAALQSLPPAERAKLERSLADLRRAADELSTMLAEHPSDALLQDLLLSTYQNELGLLARASDLQSATSLGVDL